MRLKPVRGSIRGKTSDGNTATASNNEISPEVEQRAGEHMCVCMCAHLCVMVCCVERKGKWRGLGRDIAHIHPSRNTKGENKQGRLQFIATMAVSL